MRDTQPSGIGSTVQKAGGHPLRMAARSAMDGDASIVARV